MAVFAGYSKIHLVGFVLFLFRESDCGAIFSTSLQHLLVSSMFHAFRLCLEIFLSKIVSLNNKTARIGFEPELTGNCFKKSKVRQFRNWTMNVKMFFFRNTNSPTFFELSYSVYLWLPNAHIVGTSSAKRKLKSTEYEFSSRSIHCFLRQSQSNISFTNSKKVFWRRSCSYITI